MEKLLDEIDKAIKRLVTPTALFIAAILIADNLGQTNANRNFIYTIFGILIVIAVLYMVASFVAATDKFEFLNKYTFTGLLVFLVSFFIYSTLAYSAIYIGLSKLLSITSQ